MQLYTLVRTIIQNAECGLGKLNQHNLHFPLASWIHLQPKNFRFYKHSAIS